MRIMAVIFWIMAVICSRVGSRDTCVSKNYDMIDDRSEARTFLTPNNHTNLAKKVPKDL